MQRNNASLLDIVASSKLVVEFVSGMTRDEFEQDVKTQSSVLHRLLVIGEATKRLSDEFRSSHSEIPWKQVAGMRDILIHAYDTVDIDEVWRTATKDIPDLISALEPILPKE